MGKKFSYDENGRPKILALTFDDGPNHDTCTDMLDLLSELGVKATFFVIGRNTVGCEDVLRRMVAEGHEIANHSRTHTVFTFMDPEDVAEEIARTQKMVEDATGFTPVLLRTPGGIFDGETLSVMELPFILGYGAEDYKPKVKTDERIRLIREAIEENGTGTILALHCSEENPMTLDAVRVIVGEYEEKGYTFLTVSEMFEVAGVKPEGHTLPYYNVFRKP